MNSFFKTVGLYDELSFVTTMNKTEFIENLEKLIYHSDFSFFENAEYSIPNRYEYRGYVNKNGFLVKRRRHFFDSNIPNPYIKGIINKENGKILIKIEFTPVKYFIISLIFLIVFFIIFFNITFQSSSNMSFIMIIPLIGAVTHYFTLKRNIKKGKYDFERELDFIVQKNNQFKSDQ